MMITVATAGAALSLAIWLYLLVARGGFWRADCRLGVTTPELSAAPPVVVVIPARDEAAVIGQAIGSLAHQDYPGPWRLILVDDHSSDGTGALAQQAAAAAGAGERLQVIRGQELPPGWSGKLWAMAQGVEAAGAAVPEAEWLLLTDADIRHDPSSLRRLMAHALAGRRDLVSLMVSLEKGEPDQPRGGFWGRLLIPAFVFFFQKLYPFAWVADPRRRTAGAAGGCILVRRAALERAGGLAAIRGALIDDCTLAAAVKASGGRLWLGLEPRLVSLRPYLGLAGIWHMVARTAYTQLHYSPLLLAGTLLGLAVTYLVAPLAVLTWPWHGQTLAAALGLITWLLMIVAYRPTLRLYGEPAAAGALLPLTALLYSLMTVSSALRHWRGQGGQWKGRVYSGGSSRAEPQGKGHAE